MSNKIPPTPEEIQQEFEDFVKSKFGGKVQIISQGIDARGNNIGQIGITETEEPEETEEFDLDFDLTPKEVKAYLDRFVIKQDEAKKALAIAVCDHYNHVSALHNDDKDGLSGEYSKQNVLILGPTGVGKTYMIKQIAKLIGVPFVKADATKFSETGYMGANVDDLVRDLVQQADDNIEMAQFGIVYLDEADKLAVPKQLNGRDVNGRGVQLGMLKLMEETEVDLRSGNDPASQMQAMMEFQKKGKVDKQIINTRHILFIVSGAFTGLDKIIDKRMSKKAIGFRSDEPATVVDDNILHEATTQDFIDFGFEPEFIGRLPVRVACDHLEADDLYHVLQNSEGSIINQYVAAFKAYGIKIRFTDGALHAISELAEKEKTGARALMTVCEKILRNFKYELPSSGLEKLTITEEIISNPAKELAKLLDCPNPRKYAHLFKHVQRFAIAFDDNFGLKISFTENAMEAACAAADHNKSTIDEFLTSALASYEHGLKLISQNTNQDAFKLDKNVIDNPKLALEVMIKKSYEPDSNNIQTKSLPTKESDKSDFVDATLDSSLEESSDPAVRH